MTQEEFAKQSPEEVKLRGRGYSDDMSPAAIDKRLRIVASLGRSWQGFRNAKLASIQGAKAPLASACAAGAPPSSSS